MNQLFSISHKRRADKRKYQIWDQILTKLLRISKVNLSIKMKSFMMEVNSRSTQEVLENEGVVDGTDNLKEMVK